MQTCHVNVILTVPQMDDDIRMFSYEDDFGDLDEIPLMSSGDQLVSGRGTSTTQTQTSQVSRFMCILIIMITRTLVQYYVPYASLSFSIIVKAGLSISTNRRH